MNEDGDTRMDETVLIKNVSVESLGSLRFVYRVREGQRTSHRILQQVGPTGWADVPLCNEETGERLSD